MPVFQVSYVIKELIKLYLVYTFKTQFPTQAFLCCLIMTKVFLGGMSKEYWKRMSKVYISSKVTQLVKVIPASQLQQAGTYIEWQQYRAILESENHFSDNDKGIISHYVEKAIDNYSYVFTLERKCKMSDNASLSQMSFNILQRKS